MINFRLVCFCFNKHWVSRPEIRVSKTTVLTMTLKLTGNQPILTNQAT